MLEDISHRKYKLSCELLAMTLLVSFPIMPMPKKLIEQKQEKQVIITQMEVKKYTKFITDIQLAKLYTCKDEIRNDTCILIINDDAVRLMKIAVVEDFTSAESQAWIMMVILNRVKSPLFPNTIEGVISQINPVQFASYYNGRYAKAEPDTNSHLALAMIEKGEIVTDALYFEAATEKDTWMSRNLEYVATVGGTNFYK